MSDETKRVLLVHDDATWLEQKQSLLSENGLSCETHKSGFDVPGSVRTHKAEVVALPLSTRTIAGPDLCTLLKQRGSADLKVVLYGEQSKLDIMKQINECGADHYIQVQSDLMQFVIGLRVYLAAA
jgi:DNA-binding NtrC family response regulator